MNKLPQIFELDRYGLHVRLVREEDAEFIVRLRTDEKLGKYMHTTDSNVDMQVAWLKEYKKRESDGLDYYFVFESPMNCPIGVMRIYNVTETTFTIGSWVFSKDSPKGAAILADLITKEIGHELFPESSCLWDNMKGNTNVIRFGLSFRPTLIRETDTHLYFSCSKENFEKHKKVYLRMYNYKN